MPAYNPSTQGLRQEDHLPTDALTSTPGLERRHAHSLSFTGVRDKKRVLGQGGLKMHLTI